MHYNICAKYIQKDALRVQARLRNVRQQCHAAFCQAILLVNVCVNIHTCIYNYEDRMHWAFQRTYKNNSSN